MVKKCLIALLSLFFTVSICQAAVTTKVHKTHKRYVPPLQSNLSRNKSKLIKLFTNAGIENAEELLSDPRLKLYYEFWVGGNTPGDYPSIMTPESIARGKQKILENYELLQAVEETYGVQKEILVSLWRVETNLGRYMGNYCVFNSLLTWTVSGTRRCKWAQEELIEFLIICKNLSLDPFNIPSSTCGAFGLLQFIPTSYTRFAISWRDRAPDLFNIEDAIVSAANYLQQCGWDSKYVRSQRRSIYAYNASTSYVNTVFRYAKAIRISSDEAIILIETRAKVKEQVHQIINEQDQVKMAEPIIDIIPEGVKVEVPDTK